MSTQQDRECTPVASVLLLVAEQLAASGGDARRLFHGRGRSRPGWEQVSIDFFAPVILVTLFEELERVRYAALLTGLSDLGQEFGADCIAVQSRHLAGSPLVVEQGELPRKPVAREAGLEFGLHLGDRQNLGFFLDMAAARAWVAGCADGKRVLNLFAYTCAFSVVARAAGATKVVNLDMSAAALRLGQQNHQRNGVADRVSFLGHNLFRSWPKLRRGGPYDLIIVDPPSRQPGSFVAEKDYPRVIAKLPDLCAPGAEVLLCLNSPHLEPGFLLQLVAELAPGLAFQERLANPAAFIDATPELALKVLRFKSPL